MTDATDEWAAQVRENRAEKDRFLREHRQSPVPPEERDAFDGLDYFDPDPAFRVEARVEVHDDPDPVEMETSDDRTVRYLRVVTFRFSLDGHDVALHGYRQEPDGDGIFVPFRDKTTGQQTSEYGRYMELEPTRDLRAVDRVPVDFNLAYLPFCVFNDAFACPLPPEENWLDVAVEAGERSLPSD